MLVKKILKIILGRGRGAAPGARGTFSARRSGQFPISSKPAQKRAGYRVGPVLRPNTSHGTARTAKSNTSKSFKFVRRRRKIYSFFPPSGFFVASNTSII